MGYPEARFCAALVATNNCLLLSAGTNSCAVPSQVRGLCMGCMCLDITCGIRVLACFMQMSDHLMEENSLVLNVLKLVLNTVIFVVVGPLVYLCQAVLIMTEHSSGIAKAQSPQGLVPQKNLWMLRLCKHFSK